MYIELNEDKKVISFSDLKTKENEVMISGIISRRNRHNEKGMKVNHFLFNLCKQSNFRFINPVNVSSAYHLNGSGLHLNENGTQVVTRNLLIAIRL